MLRAYRKEFAMDKFKLGWVVLTPQAIKALHEAEQSAEDFPNRHAGGDWGDLGDEHDADRRSRVLSSYRTSLGAKLYVITEHDRSATTILLPEEY
jgi:hypothetical protein